MPWAAAAAAVVGAVAGGQKDKNQTVSSNSGQTSVGLQNFADLIKGQSDLEKNSYESQLKQFSDLMGLVGKGPGESEVTANNTFQNSFATQLTQLMQKMQNPSASDISGYASKARDLFAPDQVALNQRFDDQRVEANRTAGRLGRGGMDPIFSNKLMQEKTRQQQSLDANVLSYSRQLPEMEANNMMNIGGAIGNIRSNLAAQAMNNRQMLLQMGDQLKNSERNFRMGTATHYQSGNSDTSQYSGGGFKGAMGGAMQGFSAMMPMMGGMGGGGGGAVAQGGGAAPMRSNYFG